jgi:serine/threonine protein kinase
LTIQNETESMNSSPILIYAADMILKMLSQDPINRWSCSQLLEHPFLKSDPYMFNGFDYETVSQNLVNNFIKYLSNHRNNDSFSFLRN